jgi:acetoin utilization protein AcuB
MLVKDRMSRHPITITPDISLYEALRIVREEKVRRLPVVDKKGKLVGIISEKDLLYASPSPATSLSSYELNYLIAKIKVQDLMASNVITIEEDCPLEEAARIMVDNQIGSLPVMRGDVLVGMITESDLFKVFLELLGARVWGLRVTIETLDEPGFLARLTQQVASKGGNIVSLGTFWGDDLASREITFKVQGVSREAVEEIVRSLNAEITDIRDT